MSKMSKGNLSVLAAAISSILAAPQTLVAQDVVEEVIVTGTRIQRTIGFTSPVPVTSISNEELITFAPGNTIGEALDKLPQFFNTVTAQRGGHPQFSAGRSSLDMRGMGAQRTLVLINGARTVPADISSRVNIDFIPTGLIQRVDVVTGGASAAYGADALAGVTNFILNRRFDGFVADVQAGQTAVNDGRNWRASLTGGMGLGQDRRLHLTWAVEAQRIDEIVRDGSLGARRANWQQHWGFVANPEWTPGAPASVPRQIVMPHVHGTLASPTGVINGASRREDPLDPLSTPVSDFPFLRHVFTLDGTSTYRYPYGDAGCFSGDPNSPSPICTINTTSGGPMYHLQSIAGSWGVSGSRVARQNLFLGLDREFGDRTTVFGHLIYGESESGEFGHLRPPALYRPWSATVHRDNAYLPQHIRDAMDATGATELSLDVRGQIRLPGFININDNQDTNNVWKTWSLAAGFERELFDTNNWLFTGSFQRGNTAKNGAMLREARIDRIFLAMDAVEVYADRRDVDGDGVIDLVADEDRGTGQIICNVQRYNPTDEQLRLSVISVDEGGTRNGPTVLVPAAFGDSSLGAPEELVRIPGPVATVDNTIRDCVPFNIMGTGHASPQAANYLVDDKWNKGSVTQEFAEFLLTGEFNQGIGAGPFALAVGASYRREKFWQRSEPHELMAFGPPTNAPEIGIRGITAGWSGNRNVSLFADFAALSGKFDVRELFAEFDLPLFRTANGRSLSTNIAFRRSDYSLSGEIDSAKLGIDVGITPSLRFRSTASRDVREPTFSERWDVAGGGTTVDDPFMGLLNFFTISNQVGNTRLNPEKADTVTGGFVYQPQRVSGLQVAIDYYQIDLKDQVALLPYNTVVQTCYETRDTTQTYCDFITRDPNTNLIAIINNRYVNVASAFVSGVDLEVLWGRPVEFFGRSGTLDLRVLGGWLKENSQTPFGSPRKIERAGLSQFPEYTAVTTIGYTTGPFSVRVMGRYYPRSILNMDWHTRPMQACGAAACVPDTRVASQFITNLTVGYQQELDSGRWDITATVSNLFNSDPPVIPTGATVGVAQSSAAARYDSYGRQYVVRFGYRF